MEKNNNKVKTFAMDILQECQDKGFTIEDVATLVDVLSKDVHNAIYLQNKSTSFRLDERFENHPDLTRTLGIL